MRRGYSFRIFLSLIALYVISQFVFNRANKMSSDVEKYELFNEHMTLVHKVIRRGIESMLANADACKTDTYNFMGYSLAMLENLEFHHGHEEEILFPFLQEKFPIIKTFHEQHQDLIPAIMSLKEYCLKCQQDAEQCDSKTFTDLVNKLKQTAYPHLKLEESELRPTLLREKYPDPEVLMEVSRKVAKTAQSQGSKTTTFSYLLTQMQPEEKLSMFGKVPYFVRELVFPCFTLVNYGYWKYSSIAGGQ